ncbi:hypothetical protein T492DRAFT_1098363 [Pavlovales sp. CCMP2436]|nr:hypothetical protein T492DRAFT_1098363 [Pavlovales sp. CCMP2436]
MNQPGFTYHMLHVDGSGKCSSRGRSELREQGPVLHWECLLQQLRTNGSFVDERPRLVLEVHGGFSNSTRLAKQLRAVAAAEPLASRDCVATSFALVREPAKFVTSNLHDSFKHSWFKHEFKQLAALHPPLPDGTGALFGRAKRLPLAAADYRNGALHARLGEWLPRLRDSQLRQVHVYAEGSPALSRSVVPIGAAAEVAVHRFLRALDIVGVTERGSESLLLLMRRAGLPNFRYHIAGANEQVKSFIRLQRPEWIAPEREQLALLLNASQLDVRMHREALANLDAMIVREGGRFGCQLRTLKAHKPQINPHVYPCVSPLVNDPLAPWARCIPAELCGRHYAPKCKIGELLPGQPGWVPMSKRKPAAKLRPLLHTRAHLLDETQS